ncbi:trypsin alpha-3-like [Diachasma alloeum]|uniref:trypsin alpha-3-like n=1 Tax=Diachasma alloeum TaxID=454923 RepID=UPI0007381B9F|nr:trypsin alpha-3-like [Diachasma alloeum]
MRFSFGILAFLAISNTGINAKRSARMLNGQQIDITEAPFTVMIHVAEALHSINGLVCGGSIIGRRHILTAAHCLAQYISDYELMFDYEWLHVIAGVTGHQCGVRTFEILHAYVHPDFTGNLHDTENNKADIAVLKLKDRIIYRSTHRRIDLASHQPPTNAQGFIYGWGYTDINAQSPSNTLQKTVVKIYDYETCQGLDRAFGYVKDELCMKGNPDGTSACAGDSGGPLVVDGKLVGIISNGYECGSPEPSAICNVAYYKPWIEDAIRGIAQSRTLPFTTITDHAPPSGAQC